MAGLAELWEGYPYAPALAGLLVLLVLALSFVFPSFFPLLSKESERSGCDIGPGMLAICYIPLAPLLMAYPVFLLCFLPRRMVRVQFGVKVKRHTAVQKS